MPKWTYICDDCGKESDESFECCSFHSVALIGDYPEFRTDMGIIWKSLGYDHIGMDYPANLEEARQKTRMCSEKLKSIMEGE